MSNLPKVSVIIPNYNHAKYLPKRIETVLVQTYQHLEIIILDDCSPDNSQQIIDEYALRDIRIQKVYNEQNSGSTFRQWAKGMSMATGKYIWLAESDDYADPQMLEKLVARLEDNAAIGLAYANSWYVYEDKQTIELNPEFYKEMDPVLWTKDFTIPGIELVQQFMSYRNIIPNASAVILRTSVVKQVPPPDSNMRLVGDWAYWASILAISHVAFIAEPLNYFRFHNNTVRSKSDKTGMSLVETLKMLKLIRDFGSPNPRFAQKMLDELMMWWLLTMISHDTSYPIKRHYEIYCAFVQLDPTFPKRFRKEFVQFFFGKKFSGVRQFLGDGLIYPWLEKFKTK